MKIKERQSFLSLVDPIFSHNEIEPSIPLFPWGNQYMSNSNEFRLLNGVLQHLMSTLQSNIQNKPLIKQSILSIMCAAADIQCVTEQLLQMNMKLITDQLQESKARQVIHRPRVKKRDHEEHLPEAKEPPVKDAKIVAHQDLFREALLQSLATEANMMDPVLTFVSMPILKPTTHQGYRVFDVTYKLRIESRIGHKHFAFTGKGFLVRACYDQLGNIDYYQLVAVLSSEGWGRPYSTALFFAKSDVNTSRWPILEIQDGYYTVKNLDSLIHYIKEYTKGRLRLNPKCFIKTIVDIGPLGEVTLPDSIREQLITMFSSTPTASRQQVLQAVTSERVENDFQPSMIGHLPITNGSGAYAPIFPLVHENGAACPSERFMPTTLVNQPQALPNTCTVTTHVTAVSSQVLAEEPTSHPTTTPSLFPKQYGFFAPGAGDLPRIYASEPPVTVAQDDFLGTISSHQALLDNFYFQETEDLFGWKL